jgi:membrane protein required for colicin V production
VPEGFVADLPFTVFDLIVVVVLLLSAALAYHRGLTREILAVGAWIAALAIAYYGFSELRPLVGRTIEKAWLADLITLAVVFVVPLVLLKVLFSVAAERVRGSWFGGFDRWGGALFGLARGVVLIAVLWLVVDLAIAPDDRPPWLREGVLLPYVEDGADFVAGLLPDEVQS